MILRLQTPSWPNNIKKARTEISKNYEKRKYPIKRNCRILSTFWPYIFYWNNSKLCKFCRFTTSHSFFNYFLLISKKDTVQWLNCTYQKYELNRFYNGVGVVYLLKVRHLEHPYSRCLPGNWVEVKMWKRRWCDRLRGWDRLDEGSARIFLTLGQVNPSVSLFESTTN